MCQTVAGTVPHEQHGVPGADGRSGAGEELDPDTWIDGVGERRPSGAECDRRPADPFGLQHQESVGRGRHADLVWRGG